MKLHIHVIGLAAVVLGGCLFSGADTEGLPCNTDIECGGTQQCIEHVCGGPEIAATEATLGSSDGSDGSGDASATTNDDEVRTQCDASETQCLDDVTLQLCTEAGKLATRDCTGWCGQGTAHNGCHTDPGGTDVCYCLNPEEPCTREPGDYTCDGGTLLDCVDGLTVTLDCDHVCFDAGYLGGAESCGPGDGSSDTCFCVETCIQGASRCVDNATVAECDGGVWNTYDCAQLECAEGSYSRGCTFFAGDTEACGCWEQ